MAHKSIGTYKTGVGKCWHQNLTCLAWMAGIEDENEYWYVKSGRHTHGASSYVHMVEIVKINMVQATNIHVAEVVSRIPNRLKDGEKCRNDHLTVKCIL